MIDNTNALETRYSARASGCLLFTLLVNGVRSPFTSCRGWLGLGQHLAVGEAMLYE